MVNGDDDNDDDNDDIPVITNDFVLILTHCFCNHLIIRPFLFEFLPFVI